MRLVVVSHKLCWPSQHSPSGYATDGGFPFQMSALSELFDETTVVAPCRKTRLTSGESPLTGQHLRVAPLTTPLGRGVVRKAATPFWLIRNSRTFLREIRRADAVHTPIPGDVGTVGMMLAMLMGKPLFVRHCGNWFVQRTAAERFWKSFMERFGGGKNVMLATGGSPEPPSRLNPAVKWIFSTSLTQQQLETWAATRALPAPSRVRLVIACRQEREKGTGAVIQSLPLLIKDFPGAHLDVVGDGGALPKLQRLSGSLGVSDRVTFHGKVGHDTMMRRLREGDLFCYPTTASEGFPKVVLEAMACGLPVVATRVSVLPDLIGTGCGYLLDEATAPAVAEGVRACLANPQGYGAMSRRAIETARQYSLERWRDTIGVSLAAAWGPLRSSV